MTLLNRTSARIWLLLMLATIATTWWLSKDAFGARLGTIAIFVIAALKVRFVLLYFMELRHAPLLLRTLFEAWVLALTAVILSLYLQAPLAA